MFSKIQILDDLDLCKKEILSHLIGTYLMFEHFFHTTRHTGIRLQITFLYKQMTSLSITVKHTQVCRARTSYPMMLALLDDKSTSTFVGLVGASLLKYGVSAWLATRQRPKVYEKVGRIAGLRLFPVKSCRGLEIQSAHCTKTGLHQHDVTDRLVHVPC